MELPEDIKVRLERRWLARHGQEAPRIQLVKLPNESELTDKKIQTPGNTAH